VKSQRVYKSRTLANVVAMTAVAAIAMPVGVLAQDAATQKHKAKHHHYQLVDVGTFGGPNSGLFLGGLAIGVLNNRGAFAGQANTPAIDPYCTNAGCYIDHAFVWRNGAKTDLGVLPGGSDSQVNWISANGLMTGVGTNGQLDPLLQIPPFLQFPQIRGIFWGHDGVITDVGALPGTYFANPYAVNSRGEVVGYAMNTIPDPNSLATPPNQTRAFRWDAENGMQDLGTLPGGTDAMAGIINERGQVVGWSYVDSTPSVVCANLYESSRQGFFLTTASFIWDKTNGMRDLGGFGGTCTLAVALNNGGQIVGTSGLTGDTQFQFHPFVWEAETGIVDLLDPSDGRFGFARAINDHGEIVGEICIPLQCDAALWRKSGGKWRTFDLGAIGGFGNAVSINDSGQVVGDGVPALNYTFLWEDGGPAVDLSTLVSSTSGLQFNEMVQINNRGEISIGASDANGNGHAVLLIPCDEHHPGIEGCDYRLVD
jgi:probable HAF family extracellular repeat protein